MGSLKKKWEKMQVARGSIYTTNRNYDNKNIWNYWPRGEKAVAAFVHWGGWIPSALGAEPIDFKAEQGPSFSHSAF